MFAGPVGLQCVIVIFSDHTHLLFHKRIRSSSSQSFLSLTWTANKLCQIKCNAFSKQRKDCSNFNFHIGNQMVEFTKVYRYLDIHMHENLDFSETAEVLSQAGGRALGVMISKIHGFKDVRYNTYTKMFNSCVVPVIDYCSGILGFKQFNTIDTLQNRAIQYFLGVHRFTPILAINGKMGWT